MIYFDNAATTYPKPEEVYKEIDYAQRHLAFNAERGNYNAALEAHKVIQETRKFLCNKANAKSLIFTPSATHSLNYIINGLDLKSEDVVYFSPYDHNAIVRSLYGYQKDKKFTIKKIPLKKDCSIDLEKFKFGCMKDKPKAIFCTHVSNVTGYILPIEKIGEIAKSNSSIFVVDGAQAFGLVDVDMVKSNIDYYVIAGHKTLYGPLGIGAYLIGSSINDLKLSLYGGTGTDSLNVNMPNEAPSKYEPSSPNVVGIYGMLKGSQWTFSKNVLDHERSLYKYTLEKLNQFADDVILYGAKDPESSTGIISLNIKGYKSDEVASILSSDYDICVRSGYHCCPFIHEVLYTKEYLGTVRISYNYFNTKEEIDVLIGALEGFIYEP